jgi:hypothetical protein
MNENNQPDSEQHLQAPPKLVAALKENSQEKIFVPVYIDRNVLEAARRQLNKPAKTPAGGIHHWIFLWSAFAIGCVVSAGIIWLLMTPSPRFAREDLNHDGTVDILDSFALARELKSGNRLPAGFDVNGDGVVDERDVALIAARAVAIGKESRS